MEYAKGCLRKLSINFMTKKRTRKKTPPRKSFFSRLVSTLAIFLSILVVTGYVLEVGLPSLASRNGTRKVTVPAIDVKATLNSYGISSSWISQQGKTLNVRLPAEMHPLLIYQKLSRVIAEKGGKIEQGKAESTGKMSLAFTLENEQLRNIWFIPDTTLHRTNAEIAIIIDDFGYHRNETVQALIDLPFEITYSIIPGLSYSVEIAELLGKMDKAVMIHIPMEPQQGPVEDGEFTLLTKYEPKEISKRIEKAVKAVPFAKGINNHMGSKATTDSLLLDAAFKALRKDDYFFIDSRTSTESIAYAMARKRHVPALENDLFLDPVDEVEEIEKKMFALADVAAKNGHAIAIGHPRPNTLAVLHKVMPVLSEQGFRFVQVNQLIKEQSQ